MGCCCQLLLLPSLPGVQWQSAKERHHTAGSIIISDAGTMNGPRAPGLHLCVRRVTASGALFDGRRGQSDDKLTQLGCLQNVGPTGEKWSPIGQYLGVSIVDFQLKCAKSRAAGAST